jgi:SAM-dependent methyltransferase
VRIHEGLMSAFLAPFSRDLAAAVGVEPGLSVLDIPPGGVEDLPDGAYDLITCQQGLQFFPDRPAALRAMRAALAPGGRVAIATWSEAQEPWLELAFALARHIGLEAGTRMLAPFGLADPDELRTLVEEAGFVDVVVERRTLTAHLAPVDAFARRLVLATPVAGEFQMASPAQRERIVADVSDAVGDGDELVLTMTTNLAVATR